MHFPGCSPSSHVNPTLHRLCDKTSQPLLCHFRSYLQPKLVFFAPLLKTYIHRSWTWSQLEAYVLSGAGMDWQAFAIVSLISKYGPAMVVKVLGKHTEELDLTLATDQHGKPE